MQKLLKSKRGAIIALWAILLPVIVGMIGFVVDIGAIYVDRTKLQYTADAAALAGAAKIDDEAAAKSLATAYVTKNSTAVTSPDITITTNKEKQKQVNVNLTKNSPTYFLKVFKIYGMDISVHAAATGAKTPGLFDYAMVIDEPEKNFTIFGGGAPANTSITGSIYINANEVFMDDNTSTTKEHNDITGYICTTSSKQPTYMDNKHNKDKFGDKIITNTPKLDFKTETDSKIKELLASTTTYNSKADASTNHPWKTVDGIDYSQSIKIFIPKGESLNFGPLYQDGESTLAKTKQKIIIIAEGDLNLSGIGTISGTADVTLCSIHGNIKFDGVVEKGAHFKCLAPEGTLDFVGGNISMIGYLVAHHMVMGDGGTLNITSDGSLTGGDKISKLRLVE